MPREKIKWPPDKLFAGFTPHRDGWAKSYKGRTIVVSGKRRTERDVRERYSARCREIDLEGQILPTANDTSLRDACAAWFNAIDARVTRNTLRPRTRDNLQSECVRFVKFVGADRLVGSIGPNDFARYYARHVDGKSPYTAETVISRVSKMFRWFIRNGIITNVIFGDVWTPPPNEQLVDRRLSVKKSFKPDELARMWRVADPMWRVWIALGLIAAFTPADLTEMTHDVLKNGVIDYRRRKSGKVRRIIPLPPAVLTMLNKYQRPDPALPQYRNHVFLNSFGRPFGSLPNRAEISRDFRTLQENAECYRKGRNFTGLRTTCFNAMLNVPPLTRGLIIGRRPHDMNKIDWESYVEDVDVESVRHVVSDLWKTFKNQVSGATP